MALDVLVAEDRTGTELRYRLLEWPSRALVWSDRRAIESADTPRALAALAERVAVELLPELERHALAAVAPLSGEAWRRYLECREQVLFLEDHEVARAVATELEALVSAYPAFLAARPPLIRLYNTDYFFTRAGSTGPAERARAFNLARDMVRRDPLMGHGWIVLGWGHLWRAEWRQAEDALERAVELNPHHPQRLCEAGFGLLHVGRVDRCEALMERARQIARHPDAMWWSDFGILRFVQGSPVDAHEALGEGLASFIWTHVFRLAAAVEAGLDPRQDAETLAGRLSKMFGGQVPGPDALHRWLSTCGQPFWSDAVPARLRTAMDAGLGLA
jgi:tetratricopeptide (TPR) repeat protein